MSAPIRRILVALDTSPHGRAALEEAAELAAGLQAELMGMFVLDADLLRLSGLPLGRETGLTSAQHRDLDPARMERALRSQAETARRALERTASKRRLQSSFLLGRGSVAGELIEAANHADIVAMGMIGHMGLAGRRLGSTTRQIRTRTRCSLLLLAPGTRPGNRVVAVCTGSAHSERGLELALELALRRGAELIVLPCSDDPTLRERLAGRVAGGGVAVRFGSAPSGFEDLIESVRAYSGGIVILGQDCALLAGRDEQLERLGCPVLLACALRDETVTAGGSGGP